jgi:hypothetical protein
MLLYENKISLGMYSWCDFEMAGTTIGPSDAAADD